MNPSYMALPRMSVSHTAMPAMANPVLRFRIREGAVNPSCMALPRMSVSHTAVPDKANPALRFRIRKGAVNPSCMAVPRMSALDIPPRPAWQDEIPNPLGERLFPRRVCGAESLLYNSPHAAARQCGSFSGATTGFVVPPSA